MQKQDGTKQHKQSPTDGKGSRGKNPQTELIPRATSLASAEQNTHKSFILKDSVEAEMA